MSRTRHQEPLPFAAPKKQTFANFVGAANNELVTLLSRPHEQFLCVWLHGLQGAGKTHILQAAVDVQRGYGRAGTVLDMRTCQLPDSADGFGCLALDHLPEPIGSVEAERVLMGLYQTLLGGNGLLLIAAAEPPSARVWHLPDLASRMRAAQTFAVAPLDEQEVRTLLTRKARERGLALPRAVMDYWLSRRTRALPSLLEDLERLDEAAWVEQRRLTVPFMKGVLEP